MGLQVVMKAILGGSIKRALVVTPKPLASVSNFLMDIARSELSQTSIDSETIEQRCRSSLESVMLSVVFNLDGLWQTLSEFQLLDTDSHIQEPKLRDFGNKSTDIKTPEIQDSDDEELSQTAEGPCGGSGQNLQASVQSISMGHPRSNSLPEIMVITHFSSLLTSLFAEREKAAAHQSLEKLKERLRSFRNVKKEYPLILLLNSSSLDATESFQNASAAFDSSSVLVNRAAEPTLRSVFALRPNQRAQRPAFGLIFSRFLDLHLLCTTTSPICHRLGTASQYCGWQYRSLALVEVLHDERKSHQHASSREQRWTVLERSGFRIIDPDVQETGSYP